MSQTSHTLVDNEVLDAARRVQREFIEMPGLRLTQAQAARLCALAPGTCEAAVAHLVEMRFLIKQPRAILVRASDVSSGA